MHVADYEIKELGDSRQVSADVDGFRLWFRVPRSYPVSSAGDLFVAAALLPAMRQGEKLEMDSSLPVSPKLLSNVVRLEDILLSWNPKELKRIEVNAAKQPAVPVNSGAMAFFSGGVDSTYTFLKRASEISYVVLIHGFDFYFGGGGGESFSVADLKDLGNGDLGNALCGCMKRIERSQLLRDLDRVLLGGLLKKASRVVVKETPIAWRIDIVPSTSWCQ